MKVEEGSEVLETLWMGALWDPLGCTVPWAPTCTTAPTQRSLSGAQVLQTQPGGPCSSKETSGVSGLREGDRDRAGAHQGLPNPVSSQRPPQLCPRCVMAQAGGEWYQEALASAFPAFLSSLDF